MWRTIAQLVMSVAPAVVSLFANKQRTKLQEVERIIELMDSGTIDAAQAIDLIRKAI